MRKFVIMLCCVSLIIFGCSDSDSEENSSTEQNQAEVPNSETSGSSSASSISSSTENSTSSDTVAVLGKAVTLSQSSSARASLNNVDNINDVTNYYTFKNGILSFDTTRGPAYHINLNTQEIISCTSSGAVMSSCKEVEDGVWEIALYSDELPVTATYKFDERYQTTKKVTGSGGTASGEYDTSFGQVSYSDGTFETVYVDNNTGDVQLYYGKDDVNYFYCKTTVSALALFNVQYSPVGSSNQENKSSSSSEAKDATITRNNETESTCEIYGSYFQFDFDDGEFSKTDYAHYVLSLS